MTGNTLPNLEKFLEETVLPCSKMTLAPASGALPATASKLGGTPYLPAVAEPPRDSDGERMVMLGQINFADVIGSGLPNLPSEGLLQFWVSRGVGVHGLVFDNEGVGFAAVFRPKIDESLQRPDAGVFPSSVNGEAEPALPFEGEIACSFKEAKCSWNGVDESVSPPGGFEWEDLEAAMGKRRDLEGDDAPYHRMGGYAYFTQSDPRPAGERWLLLWQVDTDDGVNLMWGDSGICNVFIREEDLLSSPPRFDRVMWNWDCC